MTERKVSSSKIGPFELYSIETGRFRLDGGAMFGVVPKTLWSKHIQPDEKNRIPMAMRCLLIKSGNTGKIYLVDNGSGTKFDEKMSRIYDIDYEHSDLLSSLNSINLDPDDITELILSHLHFDHCGGTTFFDDDGNLQHRFPNAIYHVNDRHLQSALNPNAREKASFFKENIEPISKSDRLNLIADQYEFEPGITILNVEGHTVGQQLPVIQAEGKTLVFSADLIPTHVHVPLPWVMAYDMEPLKTLKEKEEFLISAAEKKWFLFLEHDAETEVVTVQNNNGRFTVDETLSLSDV
jgi:glyoxylase-like metal-dependent hydrolase (beta-lactamase superfamily II)